MLIHHGKFPQSRNPSDEMTQLLFLKEIDDRLEISQVLNPEYSIVKLEQTGRVAERERRTAVRLFFI